MDAPPAPQKGRDSPGLRARSLCEREEDEEDEEGEEEDTWDEENAEDDDVAVVAARGATCLTQRSQSRALFVTMSTGTMRSNVDCVESSPKREGTASRTTQMS